MSHEIINLLRVLNAKPGLCRLSEPSCAWRNFNSSARHVSAIAFIRWKIKMGYGADGVLYSSDGITRCWLLKACMHGDAIGIYLSLKQSSSLVAHLTVGIVYYLSKEWWGVLLMNSICIYMNQHHAFAHPWCIFFTPAGFTCLRNCPD
jgi:hypothetical protein